MHFSQKTGGAEKQDEDEDREGDGVAVVRHAGDSTKDRLEHAEQSMPLEFQILIVGGALLVVAFLSFFGSANARVQTMMVSAVAALIGFNLLIVLVLDHPFSGDVTISDQPFREGALAVLFP